MYSIVVDGKVLDYKYKRTAHSFPVYNFYIGDIFIGQIFKLHKRWSPVTFHTVSPHGPINGFANRFYASEYMLWVCGFIKRENTY